MECKSAVSCGVVRELLTRYNYEEWKTVMKNYLTGEDLWDVVEGEYALTSSTALRDAKALHIIQLSCASDIFDQIKHFETAYLTWNHLAEVCSSKFKDEPHIRHGVVSDNVSQHKDLYKFVENDDWDGASLYLRDQPDAISWAALPSGRTVLHVATLEGHLKIVNGLLNLRKKELIEIQDEYGNTALALAAGYTGDIHIARRFLNIEGGNVLLGIHNKEDEIPLLLAAKSGYKRMTRYLFYRTPPHVLQQQSSRIRVLLLERCILAHIFDVALQLLNSYPELPTESLSNGCRSLHDLARMPSAFLKASPLQTIVYNLRDGTLIDLILIIMRMVGKLVESTIYGTCSGEKSKNEDSVFGHKNEFLQILEYYKSNVEKFNSSQLGKAKVKDAMLDAAKHGNVEFISYMWKANHDLIWAIDNNGRDIFSYAVLHRNHNVFKLMRTLCGYKDIINYSVDKFHNNLLHLAARLGPFSDLNLRPGAALQMQREIQWFKAVEEVVHLKSREAKNDEYKKPEEIFIETHKELLKDGEKWAKETAGTFAIVGVLVITIMFAALFTVPGGFHQETGVPIFISDKLFTVFIVADGISLFASIITVLMYIDLQTSRYAAEDFLQRLPSKIMSGLGFLSLSLISMMVSFCAALAIVLHKSWVYRHFFIVFLLCLPFILFVPSQLRLLLEIFQFITSNPITRQQKSKNLPGLQGKSFWNLSLPFKAH